MALCFTTLVYMALIFIALCFMVTCFMVLGGWRSQRRLHPMNARLIPGRHGKSQTSPRGFFKALIRKRPILKPFKAKPLKAILLRVKRLSEMTQVWMGVWFPQLLLQYQRYRLTMLDSMTGTMSDTMTGSMTGSGAAQVQIRVQTQFQTQNQPKAVPTAAASEPFDPQVPMALYDSRKLVIHSACPAAQAKGVTAGMSVGSAQSLLGELQLWPLQEVDSEALRDWLCQWSYDFSARIWPPLLSGLTEQAAKNAADARWPTDTLLLEVGSMVKLFGSLSAIVEAYLNKVADYGLKCSLVLAHRPLDAAILARHTHVGISAVSAAFMSTPTAEKAGHLKVHHGLPPD